MIGKGVEQNLSLAFSIGHSKVHLTNLSRLEQIDGHNILVINRSIKRGEGFAIYRAGCRKQPFWNIIPATGDDDNKERSLCVYMGK